MALDPRPGRTDLTSRECAKLIGGTIGCLVGMASVDAVREAIRWWAGPEAKDAWLVLGNLGTAGPTIAADLIARQTDREPS